MKHALTILTAFLFCSLPLNAISVMGDTVISRDSVPQLKLAQSSANGKNTDKDFRSITNLPLSPQAAALTRYGDIPVSPATGVPNISIPLYTIQMGKYTMPVSISYHASGIKVSDIASPVGLGWTLNAGGAITRSVRGIPDRECDTEYYSYSKIRDIVENSKLDEVWSLFSRTDADKPIHDTESDRYVYNFAGKSGVFVYDFGSICYQTLDYQTFEINVKSSMEKWFQIFDTDGCTYNFSEPERSGCPDEGGFIDVSALYLSSVNTPYGNIYFKYRKSPAITTYSCSEELKVGTFPIFNEYDEVDYEIVQNRIVPGQTVRYIENQVHLTEIDWNGNKIIFDYKDDRKDIGVTRLVKMIVINSNGQTVKTVIFNNNDYLGSDTLDRRMLLSSVSTSDEGTYTFKYNRNHLPPYPSVGGNSYCCTDYWGYYNGSHTKTPFTSSFVHSVFAKCDAMPYARQQFINSNCDADRRSRLEYAQRGTLTSITYPTGGSTYFTYELNTPNDAVGGLRISRISDYTNGRTMTRSYTYVTNGTYDIPENLMWRLSYQTYRGNLMGSFDRNYIVCLSDPMFPCCNNNSMTAYYPSVKETFSNGDYIVYEYDKGVLQDRSGEAETPRTGSEQYSPQFSDPSLNDEGGVAPIIKRKTYFDKENNAVRTEKYEYDSHKRAEFSTGTRIYKEVVGAINDINITTGAVRYKKSKAVSKLFTLRKKTTVDNLTGLTTTEEYEYETDSFFTLKPIAVTVTNSDGRKFRTEYTYACMSPVPYGNGDQLVETRKYSNGSELSRTWTDYIGVNNHAYPERTFVSIQGNAPYEVSHVDDYNSVGNPGTVILNASDTATFKWDSRGVYPVEYSRYGHIVNSYSWKPLVGVTSITAENGYKTHYGYDTAGRLNTVSDYEGVSQRYEYQYINGYGKTHNDDNFVKSVVNFSADGASHSINMQYCDALGRPTLTATDGMGGKASTSIPCRNTTARDATAASGCLPLAMAASGIYRVMTSRYCPHQHTTMTAMHTATTSMTL